MKNILKKNIRKLREWKGSINKTQEKKEDKWIKSVTVFFPEGKPTVYSIEENPKEIKCWIDEWHNFLYITHNHQMIGYNLDSIVAYKVEFVHIEVSDSYSSPGSDEFLKRVERKVKEK